MKILPINTINRSSNCTPKQTSFKCFQPNLSNKILTLNRRELLELAEYLHKSSDVELRHYTRSSKEAYALLKEAVEAINVRKKCFIADGAFQHKVQELEEKAANHDAYLIAEGLKR